jgi:hypothetical protein
MTTTAQSIVKRAATVLKDKTGVRWPADELVEWLIDFERELAVFRPDAYATVDSVALVAGHKQTLPDTCARLIDIPANATGTKLPISLVERSELDAIEPGWRALAASAVILHYLHDTRSPQRFEVYPPASVGTQVDVEFSKYPPALAVPAADSDYTDVTGNISAPDKYANAAVDYVLYRAFSKDSELTVNAVRASNHYRAFALAVGIKMPRERTDATKAE